MRHLLISLILLTLMTVVMTCGQTQKPEPADGILKAAIQKAESSNKTVFLIFHASWCGWCKRLDAALEDRTIKELMEEHYVIARLDVLESGNNIQTLENPGGKKIMTDLGGEKSGLPFYAFLDAKGKKIADSNVMPKDQNIGYPNSPEEIVAFEKLLTRTAPRMSVGQRATIVAYLQKKASH
jgi:thioredoxin-related protein